MTTPSMVIVTGSVTARPDTVDEVEALCLAHVHRSRTEPGCLLHSVHRDVENDRRFVFVEHWSSLADLHVHFAVPESGELIGLLRDLTEDMSPIEIYEVVSPTPSTSRA
ncbi:MAG: putative quinol monooxygenase [Acidimicrobiales bacterium]